MRNEREKRVDPICIDKDSEIYIDRRGDEKEEEGEDDDDETGGSVVLWRRH